MRSVTVGDGGNQGVLVHGNELCGEFYRPLAERLAERGFTMALLTLSGFHSEAPLPRPSWDGLSDQILSAVQDPPEAKRLLVGHSMGGLLAYLAAAKAPERFSHLVLIEPSIFAQPWLARQASRSYLRANALQRTGEFTNWNGGQRRVHRVSAYPADMLALHLESRRLSDVATGRRLFPSLASLCPLPTNTVKTLLITGANTGFRGRLLMTQMARWLRPEKRVQIPKAAHWIVNEQDEAVASAIESFVRQRAPNARSKQR